MSSKNFHFYVLFHSLVYLVKPWEGMRFVQSPASCFVLWYHESLIACQVGRTRLCEPYRGLVRRFGGGNCSKSSRRSQSKHRNRACGPLRSICARWRPVQVVPMEPHAWNRLRLCSVCLCRLFASFLTFLQSLFISWIESIGCFHLLVVLLECWGWPRVVSFHGQEVESVSDSIAALCWIALT